jgi:hypothetical protein
MIHGCLQVFASELSVEASRHRDVAALVLFHGQTVGPIAYGFGIENLGKLPTPADVRGRDGCAGLCLRAAAAADKAGGCEPGLIKVCRSCRTRLR